MPTKTKPRPKGRPLTAAGPAPDAPVATPPVPATAVPPPPASPLAPEPSDSSPDAPDTSKDLPTDSAMLCLIPAPDIAAKLVVDGGQPANALHVTLMYLGPTADLDREDLEDAIASTLEAMAELGDDDDDQTGDGGAVDPDEDGDADSATLSGIFNGATVFMGSDDPNGTPIVATLDAPGLMPLADTLSESLRGNVDGVSDPTHGLVPHCSVQFVPEGADLGSLVATLAAKLPIAVSFDHVVLAFGDMTVADNLTFFPLSGDEPQIPAEASDPSDAQPAGNDSGASDPGPGQTGFPAPASGNGTAPQAADGAPVTAAGGTAPAPPAAVPDGQVPPAAPDPAAPVTCPACGNVSPAGTAACPACGGDLPHVATPPVGDGTPAPGDGAPGTQGISRFKGTRGYPAAWATGDVPPTDGSDPTAPDAAPDAGGKVQPVVGQLGMWEACIVTAGQPTDADNVSRLIPSPDTLGFRTPPLPVTFTLADTGHSDAPIGAAATEVTWDGDNLMARGPYLSLPDGSPTPQGQAFKDAVDGGAPISPSIDMGGSAVWEELVDESEKMTLTLVSGIVCGFAVLPFAAQDTTWIRSVPNSGVAGAQQLPTSAPAGIPGEPTPPPVMASGALAVDPGMFANPHLTTDTPLTIEVPPGGSLGPGQRITGHLATWKTCHRSFTAKGEVCLTPPRSKTDYRSYKTGAVLCADGTLQPVGAITVGHGHSPHFDTSSYVAAYINVGDDEYGIWASGVTSPWATPEQLFALQASPPSGEWDYERDPRTGRRIPGGDLELMAVLGVVKPGFPVYRVKAVVASGQVEHLSIVPDFGQGAWAVTGAADLPLADRDTSWDGDAAAQAVAKYASSDGSGDPDKIDWGKYSQAFFWRDDSDGGTPKLGDFKLGFAGMVNGRLEAIPNGVIAVAGVLSGARGGAQIPAQAQTQIKGRVAAYYNRINKADPDSDLTPPWEDKAAIVAAGWRRSGLALFELDKARVRGGISIDQQRVLDHAWRSAKSRIA